MEKRTYQFAASENGWRKAKPFLVHNICHAVAACIAYGLSIQYGGIEVRYSDVTGYENLLYRNLHGELLWNGGYTNENNLREYIESIGGVVDRCNM